ncbi:MAG: hypothetical protein IIT93_03100 [Paludibacteraceae bacterium]|nr:hypothetical protein [Paludibacteraceae bacterium]
MVIHGKMENGTAQVVKSFSIESFSMVTSGGCAVAYSGIERAPNWRLSSEATLARVLTMLSYSSVR